MKLFLRIGRLWKWDYSIKKISLEKMIEDFNQNFRLTPEEERYSNYEKSECVNNYLSQFMSEKYDYPNGYKDINDPL